MLQPCYNVVFIIKFVHPAQQKLEILRYKHSKRLCIGFVELSLNIEIPLDGGFIIFGHREVCGFTVSVCGGAQDEQFLFLLADPAQKTGDTINS